jgi:hypothetical protein
MCVKVRMHDDADTIGSQNPKSRRRFVFCGRGELPERALYSRTAEIHSRAMQDQTMNFENKDESINPEDEDS